MANSLSSTPQCSLKTPNQPGLLIGNPSARIGKIIRVNELVHQCSRTIKFQSLVTEATTGKNKGSQINSIVCSDCEGNGAVNCSQCKGSGVNSEDHYNGQFKAGGLCWLCRGKRDILCGNCNGAGFIGGFMSTHDE